MKILLTEWFRDWRGDGPQPLQPTVFSLDDKKMLFTLLLLVGNGEYDEACIETDSMDATESVRGLLCGTGNAKLVGRSSAVEACRLFRAGYEIYLQGSSSYFFVNPSPRPELFVGQELDEYVKDFHQT